MKFMMEDEDSEGTILIIIDNIHNANLGRPKIDRY